MLHPKFARNLSFTPLENAFYRDTTTNTVQRKKDFFRLDVLYNTEVDATGIFRDKTIAIEFSRSMFPEWIVSQPTPFKGRKTSHGS
jgi:hypothetical protein